MMQVNIRKLICHAITKALLNYKSLDTIILSHLHSGYKYAWWIVNLPNYIHLYHIKRKDGKLERHYTLFI